jgi:prevent-host-death family protein
MGKQVSAGELKARCLELIEAMRHDGEPVTITRGGRAIAKLLPLRDHDAPPRSVIGMLRHPAYRADWDHAAAVLEPGDWAEPSGEASSLPR